MISVLVLWPNCRFSFECRGFNFWELSYTGIETNIIEYQEKQVLLIFNKLRCDLR